MERNLHSTSLMIKTFGQIESVWGGFRSWQRSTPAVTKGVKQPRIVEYQCKTVGNFFYFPREVLVAVSALGKQSHQASVQVLW